MKKVELEIYKANGGIGLVITCLKEDESGYGHRFFGPKLYGQSVPLKIVSLTEKELDEFINEFKEAKKFLTYKKRARAK